LKKKQSAAFSFWSPCFTALVFVIVSYRIEHLGLQLITGEGLLVKNCLIPGPLHKRCIHPFAGNAANLFQ
jgi:hypothetical protein